MYDLADEAGDYPLWTAGTPDRSFVVCATVRTGSTLLGEVMRAVGGLGCPLEYFHSGFQPAFERRWPSRNFDEYRAHVFRHRTDPTGSFGVKLFWRDVMVLCERRFPGTTDGLDVLLPEAASPQRGYEAVWTVLTDLVPSPRFILLSRRDKARQAISAVTAMQTGRWREVGLPDEARPAPVYDYETILRTYQHAWHCHNSWLALFAHAGVSPIQIFYEDLARDLPGTVGRLLEALGRSADHLDVLTQAPRLRRQASVESEQLLARFLRDCAARRIADAHS